MKNHQKKLVIILGISCMVGIAVPGLDVFAFSAGKDLQEDKYTMRVTREEFAEFCDSLIIPEEKEKIKLDTELFNSFDIATGNFEYKEMFSINNEKFQPNVLVALREKQAEEETEQQVASSEPAVYQVSFANRGKGIQTVNFGNDNKISSNSFMMMDVEDKKSIFDFDKTLQKVKYAISQGNYSEASHNLDIIEKNSKGNNRQLFTAANLYEKINRPEKASEIYKELSASEPEKVEYVYSYAVSLYRNNNMEEAEKLFKKAAELKPDFMYAHYNLGNVYYKKADYYKALDSFNKALELSPANADIYYNIAVTLEEANHLTLAKKYYRRCIDLNPDDEQAKRAYSKLD